MFKLLARLYIFKKYPVSVLLVLTPFVFSCSNGIPITKLISSLNSFQVTGVTGGTDSTVDAYLSDAALATVVVAWNSNSGATSYDVTITDMSDVVLYGPTNTTSLTQSFAVALVDNTQYKAKVSANMGGSSVSTSLTFLTDKTAPVAGAWTTPAANVGTNGTSYALAWVAATETGSGLATNGYGVEYSTTGCGGPWTATGSAAVPSFTISSLSTSTTYNIRVLVTDKAGNVGTSACSPNIAVDNTAPTWTSWTFPSAAVFQNTTTYNLVWPTATDTGGSGLAATPYTINLYGGAGCTSFISSVGPQLGLSYNWVGLTTGNTYSATVTVADAAGNTTTSPCSSDILVDTVNPTWGSFSTPAANTLQNTTSYNFTWSGEADAYAGLDPVAPYNVYKYNAAGCGGGPTIVGWQAAASYNWTGMTTGNVYSARVYVKDRAGNILTGPCSNNITVDISAPTWSGWLAPTAPIYQTSNSYIASWAAAGDAGGGGLGATPYDVKIYTDSGCTVQVGSSGAIAAANYNFTPLTLGQYYYFKVDMTDAAGNTSNSGCSNPNGVMFDNVAPTWNGFLTPATNTAINTANYNFTWSAATDSESGLHATNAYRIYKYSAAGCGGGPTVTGWQTATSYMYTLMTNGNTYSIKVETQDKAGNTTMSACSNNVTVDTVTPGAFTISGVSGGTDVTPDNFLTSATTPQITWSASASASSYQVDIKDVSDTVSICGGGDTGVAGSPHTMAGCTNTSSTKYVVHVKALSPTGLNVTAATNDGFTFTQTGQWLPAAAIANFTGASTLAARARANTIWAPAAGRMFIWGGIDFGGPVYYNDGDFYDPSSDSWSGGFGSALTPRGNSAIVYRTSDGSIIVWGGSGAGGVYYGDGDAYYPGSGWAAMDMATGAPAARAEMAAVYDPGHKYLIIQGGRDGVGAKFNAGRYDLVAGTWIATSNPAAIPRANHTGVWTGTEMIIWGGWDTTAGGYNTGSRYDPTSNIWTPTAVAGAPTARAFHSGVWTGSKMIVWGGTSDASTNFNALNTGSLYDPVSNTWSAMTTIGAPPPVHRHVTGWDNVHNKMFIWGGVTNGDGVTNIGRVYDPNTDSWEPLGTDNPAPTARGRTRAVWTGDRFIIWGGDVYVGSAPFNDGGIYVP